MSYPKDLVNSNNQEFTYIKQTTSKSNKPGSSPYGSQDDPMIHERPEQYHNYYASSKHRDYYQPAPLRLSPQRADHDNVLNPYDHYMQPPVYPTSYQYTMPRAQLMGYQQMPPQKAYPYTGPFYGYTQQNNRTSPEIYRNLNNEIASKPINPKHKTGSQAVGSCPSDLHIVTGSDDGVRRIFPLSRGYSNYITDFGQQKAEQPIIPQRRVLNRIGTFDFAYSKEDSPGGQGEHASDYNHTRYMFQNNKSNSLHPDDLQRIEYRAANLSPSRIKVAPNTELFPLNSLFYSSGVMKSDHNPAKPKIKIQQQQPESNSKEKKEDKGPSM